MRRLFALLVIAGVLASCSKDDNGGGDGPSPSALLVKKISSTDADGSLEGNFEYDGNKLRKAVYTGVSDEENIQMTLTATYSGNKITKLSINMSDEGAISNTYTYDGDRLIKEVNTWEGYGSTTYLYTWESDDKVRRSPEDQPNYYEDFYFENGNLVKVVDYFGGGVWKVETTYDDKHNPFSGIEGFQYLVDENMFSQSRNNPLKENLYVDDALVETTTYEYDYNSAGYPIVVRESDDEGVVTTNITYY